MSLLVIFEILRIIVNTFAADDKYYFLVRTVNCYQFKCNYLRNKNLFLNFLVQFCNLEQI